MTPSYSPERPGCITAYAVLIWLGGVLFAFTTFDFISKGNPAALCGGVFVILAIITGYGLWQMREWSWWLVVILQSLSLLGSLFSLFAVLTSPYVSEGILGPLVGAVGSGIILYWFVTNRSHFLGAPVYRTVVGPDGETMQELVSPSGSSKTGIIVAGVVILVVVVPVVIIAILTLLGPQVGNVFSRIVTGLESTPMP